MLVTLVLGALAVLVVQRAPVVRPLLRRPTAQSMLQQSLSKVVTVVTVARLLLGMPALMVVRLVRQLQPLRALMPSKSRQ